MPWQVDDARGIWPSARLTLFEDRAYLSGECCGNPVGVAFDLTSGRRTGWVPVGIREMVWDSVLKANAQRSRDFWSRPKQKSRADQCH